jgi:hypothetical protein
LERPRQELSRKHCAFNRLRDTLAGGWVNAECFTNQQNVFLRGVSKSTVATLGEALHFRLLKPETERAKVGTQQRLSFFGRIERVAEWGIAAPMQDVRASTHGAFVLVFTGARKVPRVAWRLHGEIKMEGWLGGIRFQPRRDDLNRLRNVLIRSMLGETGAYRFADHTGHSVGPHNAAHATVGAPTRANDDSASGLHNAGYVYILFDHDTQSARYLGKACIKYRAAHHARKPSCTHASEPSFGSHAGLVDGNVRYLRKGIKRLEQPNPAPTNGASARFVAQVAALFEDNRARCKLGIPACKRYRQREPSGAAPHNHNVSFDGHGASYSRIRAEYIQAFFFKRLAKAQTPRSLRRRVSMD